jgi:hypothetical protein
VQARSTMREKPGADNGAPLSDTNTNAEAGLSRWCRRSSRISRPLSGCVAGVPFLALRMCRDAVLKSTCSHVTVAVAIALGCLDELLDLLGGEVLTGAQIRIWGALRRDCSIFSGWRDQAQVRICHGLCAPLDRNCSKNGDFMNSGWMRKGGRSRPNFERAMTLSHSNSRAAHNDLTSAAFSTPTSSSVNLRALVTLSSSSMAASSLSSARRD